LRVGFGLLLAPQLPVSAPALYEYLSYDFGNSSADIAHLFLRVSEGLGLRPRINCDGLGRYHVRINLRQAVARMVENVGLKA
jgi:hypothetical protein